MELLYVTTYNGMIIDTLICINGLYDIVCSVCILYFPYTHLGKLHISCFRHGRVCGAFNRALAYWIFTYGAVRAASGFRTSKLGYILSCITYAIEATAYFNETEIVKSCQKVKGRFVWTVSILFAFLSWSAQSVIPNPAPAP